MHAEKELAHVLSTWFHSMYERDCAIAAATDSFADSGPPSCGGIAAEGEKAGAKRAGRASTSKGGKTGKEKMWGEGGQDIKRRLRCFSTYSDGALTLVTIIAVVHSALIVWMLRGGGGSSEQPCS
eukprot:363985-Chlamydomonas_euryale.AAC.6